MSAAAGTILIVDDDEELTEMLVFACKEMRLGAHTARNTAQAREWLAGNSPFLIILDIMMPGGNGLDLCRWIRQQPRLDKIPVLLSSGLKDDETAQDALELGAVEFIKKPYALKALKEKIEKYRGKAA